MSIQTRVKKLERSENRECVVALPCHRFDTHDGRIGDECTQVRIKWGTGNPASQEWQTFFREPGETAEELASRATNDTKTEIRRLFEGRNIIFLPEFAEYV